MFYLLAETSLSLRLAACRTCTGINCSESSKSYANVYKPACVSFCRREDRVSQTASMSSMFCQRRKRMEVVKNVNLVNHRYNDTILVC